MMGKTHAAAGMAAAILITQPNNLNDLVLCSAVSYIGATISDVDVTTSKSRKGLGKIIIGSAVAIIAASLFEYLFSLGIYNYLKQNSSLMQILFGLAMFIGICIFGEKCPHRTFMHSLMGGALLTAAVAIINPLFIAYFVIGFLSHIILDLLNEKSVQLLYPTKILNFSFSVCSAGKTVDKVLFVFFSVMIAIEVVVFCFKLFGMNIVFT